MVLVEERLEKMCKMKDENEYYKISKEVERIKKKEEKEMERDNEIFTSGIAILLILGIYAIGMLLPYIVMLLRVLVIAASK